MNRTMLRCAAFAAAICAATGFLVNACSSPDLVETFGEKAEWSVLQSIEFQEREHILPEPSIRTVGSSEVLGVRGQAGRNVWLLLKVHSPPYYKQIPEGNYEVSASLLSQLEKERRVSYTVSHVLRSHVRAQ
jgi:hypothetical protein